MSQGEQAAEQAKGLFKSATSAAEGIRQNINAFADDLIGSKSGTHSNSADTAAAHRPTEDQAPASGTLGFSDRSAGTHVGTHDTGLTGGGTTTGAQTSSGIHPDAERLGSGIAAAIDRAGEKLNEGNGPSNTS